MKVIWFIVLIGWSLSVAASPTIQVERFIAAYNQHDIHKMLELTTQEVKWLYNINDKILIETDSKDALRTAMVAHFKQQPNARSQIKSSLTLGNTVAVIEEAFSHDGVSSQCALSIYQLKQSLIQSVTYYAATACQQ
ncbi:MAG: nuclear transport factor 2 family protein [Paraglaciecola sp.]|uniref:nuclear transport factor 2 family protein n=1 Tax=Paraglaciecola sp. TaxID=1920173 RepID=UPI003298B47B